GQALWRSLQQCDATHDYASYLQRADGRQYRKQLRHRSLQQFWNSGPAPREHGRHQLRSVHGMEDLELECCGDHQAGKILSRDHDEQPCSLLRGTFMRSQRASTPRKFLGDSRRSILRRIRQKTDTVEQMFLPMFASCWKSMMSIPQIRRRQLRPPRCFMTA